MAEYELSHLPVDLSARLSPIKPGAEWTGFAYTKYNTNGNPETTTSWTAKIQFRTDKNAADVIVELTTSSGIVNNNSGKFSVALTAAQTALFTTEEAYFDMYITRADSTIFCPLQATFPVLWRATR